MKRCSCRHELIISHGTTEEQRLNMDGYGLQLKDEKAWKFSARTPMTPLVLAWNVLFIISPVMLRMKNSPYLAVASQHRRILESSRPVEASLSERARGKIMRINLNNG